MKLLFGGLVAVILLGLYEYSVYEAIMAVMCMSTTGCTAYNADSFSLGYSHALSGIGGLVSALVISELAITQPGAAPAARLVGGVGAGPVLGLTLKIVTALYLLVWLGAGLAAYVVGTMWYPGILQPLSDLGQSWLGIAIAAVYAYLGINQQNTTGGGVGAKQ